MKNIPLREVPAHVANHLPFVSQKLKAENVSAGIYEVRSYGTLIARHDDEGWTFNETRYSVTTTKQLHYVKRGALT